MKVRLHHLGGADPRIPASIDLPDAPAVGRVFVTGVVRWEVVRSETVITPGDEVSADAWLLEVSDA
jgi:hypothetical protein